MSFIVSISLQYQLYTDYSRNVNSFQQYIVKISLPNCSLIHINYIIQGGNSMIK